MARGDLDNAFRRIDKLVAEIEKFAPSSQTKAVEFRADLAGLLTVSIVSTYENCIKMVMIESAINHHFEFGGFVERQFSKLNSKIRIDDLGRYCKSFGDNRKISFQQGIKKRKKIILDRCGLNIEAAYSQILDWRHDFAHKGARNTTIEEAVKTHRLAKRVIYVFDEALK